jgi:hypothetical protein
MTISTAQNSQILVVEDDAPVRNLVFGELAIDLMRGSASNFLFGNEAEPLDIVSQAEPGNQIISAEKSKRSQLNPLLPLPQLRVSKAPTSP